MKVGKKNESIIKFMKKYIIDMKIIEKYDLSIKYMRKSEIKLLKNPKIRK